MNIDVCLVTKNNVTSIKGFHTVPVNRLIVETSTPLALARMRAIQKVETEWFAFIDDDVEIESSWFKTLAPYIERPDMGAVEGIMRIRGLGVVWDNAANSERRYASELHLGERGFTHNTLIRTELVKDWVPPRHVSAFEDYLLTQHILRKGYRWLRVPTQSVHNKTWSGLWNNVIWGIKGEKAVRSPPPNDLIRIIKHLIHMLRIIGTYKLSRHSKQYQLYLHLASIHGYLKASLL